MSDFKTDELHPIDQDEEDATGQYQQKHLADSHTHYKTEYDKFTPDHHHKQDNEEKYIIGDEFEQQLITNTQKKPTTFSPTATTSIYNDNDSTKNEIICILEHYDLFKVVNNDILNKYQSKVINYFNENNISITELSKMS
eukprot:136845_1